MGCGGITLPQGLQIIELIGRSDLSAAYLADPVLKVKIINKLTLDLLLQILLAPLLIATTEINSLSHVKTTL